MSRTLAALFATPAQAEAAREALTAARIPPEAIRVLPLAPPPSAGAAIAQGFARALADLGLGGAPAQAGEHTLVLVSGEAEAALPVLEGRRPLAVDRQAEHWSDPHGAALEASAGLTGQASGAATGVEPVPLTGAAGMSLSGAAQDDRLGSSEALRDARIAAERNRRG